MSADQPSNSPAEHQDENDKLSPEAEAVINRARRSFSVSILILIVGLMAVAGVLVYRTVQKSSNDQYQAQSISVPQDAQIVSAVVQSGLLTVTYKIGDAVTIRVIDATTGSVVRDIAVTPEAP